ncbi:hypothetical protein L1266_09360 [Pseudoalteromonas sp. Cn5-37]|uniref:hypothetical protein n=1 Tax=Pseudoalteromonas sp. Cn5-37 TaxID=2908886 RepID=UPI001F2108B6|nr:hypothetical protein [Pseudoalteromonas sp. Cn5-37]MCF2916403.1 hypothetical protein [Pseudoalteromonas sp. Cn5-37]
MAGPLAIVAIPAILTAIATGISELIKFLVRRYTARTLIAGIFLAAYSGAMLVFINSANSQFAILLSSLPTNSFSQAGLSLIPNNAITCASIVVGAKVAQMTLYFAFGVLRTKMKAQ